MPSSDPDELMLRIVRSARDGSDPAAGDLAGAPNAQVLTRIGRALRPEIGARGRFADDAAGDVAPPPGLWDAIAARLDEVPGGAVPSGAVPSGAVESDDRRAGDVRFGEAGSAVRLSDEDGSELGTVLAFDRGRRVLARRPTRALGPSRRRLPVLVGAAAAVLVAVVVSVGIVGRDRSGPSVVAEVALDRLAAVGSGTATATLERESDGRTVLRLHEDGLPPESGAYYEVWLIAPDITRMVSLGPLNRSGVYEVPVGVDPADYPVVDVSIEPVDGTPTHSGRSVLRGTLRV